MDSKQCSECGQVKDLDQFKKVGVNASPMRKCLTCYTETRRFNKANGLRYNQRDAHLRDNYGITQEQYDFMLQAQGGVCDICLSPDPKAAARANCFVVDHDHETGQVRGLLCHACNRALGNLQDSLVILCAAVDYKLKHQRLALRNSEPV